jgi:predicted nucleotidyltransferase
MDKREALKIANLYIDLISNKYTISQAFLFGSFAKGTNHDDSDIDIAVVVKNVTDIIDTQIEMKKLRRKVDLRIDPHLNSPYGDTPNSNFALRLPESDIVFEGCMVSRCEIAGPVYLPNWMRYPANRKYQSIKGDGFNGGGQGASGMSALGGTLRKGELTGSEAIRHADRK